MLVETELVVLVALVVEVVLTNLPKVVVPELLDKETLVVTQLQMVLELHSLVEAAVVKALSVQTPLALLLVVLVVQAQLQQLLRPLMQALIQLARYLVVLYTSLGAVALVHIHLMVLE